MSNTKTKLMEDINHFDDSVPQAVRDKLFVLATAVKDDFISEQGEAYGSVTLDAVYGQAHSGYTPLQLGGYKVTELYRNDCDPSYHFTKEQTDFNNEQSEDCYEAFARDNDLENDFTIDCMSPEMQDAFYEYEKEWFEPALLRFEIWLKDLTTVEIQLGINYSDAPYYRTQYDDTLFTTTMPIEKLLKITTEQFIQLLNKGIEHESNSD